MRNIIPAAAIIAAVMLSGSPAPATMINFCQAAKTECVSRGIGCLLGCHAKAQRTGVLDANCIQKCRRKFDGDSLASPDSTKGCIQKLQARGGCLTSDETSVMMAKIEAFVDDVVCDLAPSAGTCPDPMPLPSDSVSPDLSTPTPNPTPTGARQAKHVFLSTTEFPATFGGLDGADAACQSLAGAAGLDGTYLAWLSDGSAEPSTRFTRSADPYLLVDGVSVIANDWADLTDGTLASAIVLTETGSPLANVDVWTGTQASGQSGGSSCAGWTSANQFETGLAGLAKTGVLDWWSEYETLSCDLTAHLYCFQQ